MAKAELAAGVGAEDEEFGGGGGGGGHGCGCGWGGLRDLQVHEGGMARDAEMG